MKKWQALAAAGVSVVGLVATATSAQAAETKVTGKNVLTSIVYDVNTQQRDPAGAAAWVGNRNGVSDSPLDANAKAYRFIIPNGDAAEVEPNAALNLNKPASSLSNLSYDIRTSDIQGGSPRLVQVFSSPLSDGALYLSLSSSTCSATLNGTWSRADFTGQTNAGCTINTYGGSGSTTYSSDGTNSAYDNFRAANPGAVVSYEFMVMDEPGTYFLDRISYGTGFLYDMSRTVATKCTTEASC